MAWHRNISDDNDDRILDGTNGEVENYQNTVVLPVELLYFEGEGIGCANELRWAMVIEENNKFFIIEYSKNGEDFTAMERVEGNGNSSNLIEYSYTHRDVTNIYNYYRLPQVDYDGSMEYLEVLFIKSNCEGLDSDDIRVYPNPSKGFIIIEAGKLGLESIPFSTLKDDFSRFPLSERENLSSIRNHELL